MKCLINDDERAEAIKIELISGEYSLLTSKQISALNYADQLTLAQASLQSSSIQSMRNQGWNDGDILGTSPRIGIVVNESWV